MWASLSSLKVTEINGPGMGRGARSVRSQSRAPRRRCSSGAAVPRISVSNVMSFTRFLENWRRLLKISTPPRKTRSSTTSFRKPFPRVILSSAKSALAISHLRGEAIVGGANLNVQSGLSTGIHSNHWLQARFEPERRVSFGVRSLLRNLRSVGAGVRSLLSDRQ